MNIRAKRRLQARALAPAITADTGDTGSSGDDGRAPAKEQIYDAATREWIKRDAATGQELGRKKGPPWRDVPRKEGS